MLWKPYSRVEIKRDRKKDIESLLLDYYVDTKIFRNKYLDEEETR